MLRAATRVWAARRAELTGDLGQQMRSYPHDARYALLQHHLEYELALRQAEDGRDKQAEERGFKKRLRIGVDGDLIGD